MAPAPSPWPMAHGPSSCIPIRILVHTHPRARASAVVGRSCIGGCIRRVGGCIMRIRHIIRRCGGLPMMQLQLLALLRWPVSRPGARRRRRRVVRECGQSWVGVMLQVSLAVSQVILKWAAPWESVHARVHDSPRGSARPRPARLVGDLHGTRWASARLPTDRRGRSLCARKAGSRAGRGSRPNDCRRRVCCQAVGRLLQR